jgi:S-methylmethionine-dependent homocysteine/selenocysteine methylase
MAKYRRALPQLNGDIFLTDGGLETTLIFHQGIVLSHFAAFDLLKHPEGKTTLLEYFRTYAALARKYAVGCILESATWRANADWGMRLGYSAEALAQRNREAITLLKEIRQEYETDKSPMVISGCIGPRADGYFPSAFMDADEAQRYHAVQVTALQEADVDMVAAFTMTYAAEAIGIARAAKAVGVPVALSFTVETNGRLPNGQALKETIEQVDAATDNSPVYYMINCAHPTHFAAALEAGSSWVVRIRGLRANASTKSHKELDESAELDMGNPGELGRHYRTLRNRLPDLNVLGGCCGTDHRHIEAICRAVLVP